MSYIFFVSHFKVPFVYIFICIHILYKYDKYNCSNNDHHHKILSRRKLQTLQNTKRVEMTASVSIFCYPIHNWMEIDGKDTYMHIYTKNITKICYGIPFVFKINDIVKINSGTLFSTNTVF